MGHQPNEAISALRAYARDLEATAKGGVVSSAGTSKQDDASTQFTGSGAPHQLAIAAAVVCVVLLGGIGLASAVNSAPNAERQQSIPLSAQSASASAVLARAGGASTAQAIRAFNDLGMSRSANALSSAGGTGTDSSPAVQEALTRLASIVEEKLATDGHVSESDLGVALAIMALEVAVSPPGLDLDRLPPGLGGTPPGLDPPWDQSPDFVPPGQDETNPPGGGLDTAPGQNKEGSEQGGGKP